MNETRRLVKRSRKGWQHTFLLISTDPGLCRLDTYIWRWGKISSQRVEAVGKDHSRLAVSGHVTCLESDYIFTITLQSLWILSVIEFSVNGIRLY